MACSICCFTAEDCPDCGLCLCECRCGHVTCAFCGDPDCDGSGYNCDDGHYQEYNLRGWDYEPSEAEDAYMAEHHPTAMLTVEPQITCPRCGMTSHNPSDVREGYCGNCHDWTSAPRLHCLDGVRWRHGQDHRLCGGRVPETELERLVAYDWATREYLAGGGSNSQWIRRRPKPSFLPDGG